MEKYAIYFFCFLSIFFFHILSDIIYYTVLGFENHYFFFYFKLLEICVFLAYAFLIFLSLKFKKFINLTKKSMDFYKAALSFSFLIFYSECEFCSILDIDQNRYWDFSFLIGIFTITSLKHIKIFKLNLVCFILEMVYLAIRFSSLYELHLERILIFALFFLIYNRFKNLLKIKELKGKKEEAKLDTRINYSILLKILKECNEDGIAIFDSKKNLLFNNRKIMSFMKNDEDVNKKILKVHLNFVSLKKKSAGDKLLQTQISVDMANNNINSIVDGTKLQDILSKNKEVFLEEIFDELISSINNQHNFSIFPSIQTDIMNLTFNLLKDENSQNEGDVCRPKLILTVFLRNEKIENFLIRIQSPITQNLLLTKEKKDQNDKIYFVSHEMRTPLNCIVSMLQMLKPLINVDLADEFISPAIISCNFLLYLVQDLLDIAQIESGTFTMNFEEFDIKILISDIIELFKIQASSKNAEVSFNISKNVPEIILSDHRRIRQILINLIGNALKFIKKFNGKVTVDISVSPLSQTIIIFSVKDNGIGIKEKDKNNLFTAFGKINNEENKKINSNGVGLGLMISNKLAMNLHPTKSSGLKVESEYGFGTAFIFEIEDKNEASNINDFDSRTNLDHQYQILLKDKKTKFLSEKNSKPEIQKEILKKKNKNSQNFKKSFPSLKLSINRNSKFSFPSSTLLGKTHEINSKFSFQYKNDNPLQHRTNSKFSFVNRTEIGSPKIVSIELQKNDFFRSKKQIFYSAPSMISFDVFLNKKDLENVEAAENKMKTIKEIMMGKPCDCPQILICDDNAFNIYSLRKQLEFFGFKLDSANDGEEAIHMVKEFYNKKLKCCRSYHMIFMDIEMPLKNGYEASFEIKKFFRSVPESIDSRIIACSAHLSEESPGKYKQSGMDEFVTKPIIQGKLTLLLAKFLTVEYEFKRNKSL